MAVHRWHFGRNKLGLINIKAGGLYQHFSSITTSEAGIWWKRFTIKWRIDSAFLDRVLFGWLRWLGKAIIIIHSGWKFNIYYDIWGLNFEFWVSLLGVRTRLSYKRQVTPVRTFIITLLKLKSWVNSTTSLRELTQLFSYKSVYCPLGVGVRWDMIFSGRLGRWRKLPIIHVDPYPTNHKSACLFLSVSAWWW
jgi:hypothetical protein